jgi:M6 family metalloprotease-like protein
VNFAGFDNDGPDGVPNSGDDDGFVDVIQFIQPVQGRECQTGPGYNAHQWFLQSLGGSAHTTDDTGAEGPVRINDYFIASGVGGAACNDGQIMGMGTSAHELGHGIGSLPDLYDTNPSDADDVEGVGEWGLMGSGNYRSLQSPAHMEAWSKQQMGWVFVEELTVGGTYALEPVVTTDTVMLIRPPGANPRGEYFLLENKQPLLADTANMNYPPRPKHGGLLVWHIDSAKIATNTLPFANSVNTGAIHGVALLQADGLNHLRTNGGGNRGDGGDPYPGDSGQIRLSFDTNPALTLNQDGSFVGFELDSIRQLVQNGQMRFKLSFLTAPVVASAGTPPDGQVGVQYAHALTATGGLGTFTWSVVNGALPPGLTLSAGGAISGTPSQVGSFSADAQAASGGQTDTVTVNITVYSQLVAIIGTPPEARVSVAYSHTLTATGGPGGYTWAVQSGSLPGGLSLSVAGEVSGTPTTAGTSVATVRVTSGSLTADAGLTIGVATALSASAGTPPAGIMGATYNHQLTATGGTGSYSWAVQSGALPTGLGLAANGLVTGIAAATGSFNATARVTSGSQTADVTVAISVTAPTLATANVVSHILGTASPLSADEQRYLDLIGNANGSFDVGDFLAWVDATGAPGAVAGALVAEVLAALPGARQSGVKP